jgi:hypothetical protein
MRIVWTWRDIAVIWPSIISGEWPGVLDDVYVVSISKLIQ